MRATPGPGRNRRRRRLYLDGQLQGHLLAALVGFEVSLFAGAWLYLYGVFSRSLERGGELPEVSAMATEVAWVVLACCVINGAVLLLAHYLWAQRVHRVLAGLRERLERIDALDLRPDPAWARETHRHRLIDLCDRWIEGERRRMLAVRIAAARLPRPLPADPRSPEADDALAALQEASRQLRRSPEGSSYTCNDATLETSR